MSIASSVVARALPRAVLVPALALALALAQVQEDLLVLAQMLVQPSCIGVVATEVCPHLHCSPAVVALLEFVIHVLSHLTMAVVSVHLQPMLIALQSRCRDIEIRTFCMFHHFRLRRACVS